MNAQFSQEWALLADKGYQGLAQQLRAIHPTGAPPELRLSADEERKNDKISSDRVIVEKFLGGWVRYGEFMPKSTGGDMIYMMIFLGVRAFN